MDDIDAVVLLADDDLRWPDLLGPFCDVSFADESGALVVVDVADDVDGAAVVSWIDRNIEID